MKPATYEEVRDARQRALSMLNNGFSAAHAAGLMACEFFINIYASRGKVWAAYISDEGKECRVKLA